MRRRDFVRASLVGGLGVASARARLGQDVGPTRVIAADFNQVRGPMSKTYKKSISAGRANEGLRADWQEQLALVQKEIGFEYIRMHGLLHDDMGVYKEDAQGNPIYNWQYIDRLYDYLLSIGLKPFVELAFMPADLASGKQTVFWWKGNVTPPKTYEKWGALIRNLVTHFQERYGHDEVKTWYFEVWNEPDISPFWSADLNEYLKLYNVTAEAVKSVSRDYRVGGPASAVPYRFEEEFLKYCAREHVPVDFVSTHSYGVKEGFFDATGTKGTVLDTDKTAVRSRMIHSRELIRQSAFPNLELHFTEWSSAYTPTDYIHDQYHQAPFILDKIKGAQESVDSLSYWVFTDIFEENGPRMTPFHGGFGLLNYEGIKKPAYHAYRFLSRLGTTELKVNDDSAWVTKDGGGSIAALFWDFTPIAPPDGVNDQVFYKHELPAKDKGRVRLEISDVPAGKYWLAVYRIGYYENDPYSEYLHMGSPSQLTRLQQQRLEKASSGLPEKDRVMDHPGGTFTQVLTLRENGVVLVTLKRT
jgi:xylan 1,4-beta-xylosidase